MTKTTNELASMKEKRESSTAVVVDGRIFVMGGWNGSNPLKTVEV